MRSKIVDMIQYFLDGLVVWMHTLKTKMLIKNIFSRLVILVFKRRLITKAICDKKVRR